ncbi:MAG: hypothetical protein HY785_02535 [Oscillatoriophycideae cyanobacterium NC_groundwater_1537_Pr4_S-0.65um_50_18]|nr:hypothetical protein [Oscillatoriophycideae cyanobacterium NC_groundwater_1537_Pr4_S-0.65um_50_18]
MLYPSINTSRPWSTLAKQIKQSAASLALGAGFAIAGLTAFPATAETSTLAQNDLSSSSEAQALTDGTYLYGQSQVAEQLGSAYMVFEVSQGKVLGAFYMPRSSFDCFYGNLEADRVALTVVDSYEKSAHPYDVALESSAPVAMAGDEAIAAPVGLEGFQRLESLSENDQRILSTCKANYPDQL